MSAIASKVPTVARVLLGLGFLIPGLNGFFHFLPQPPMPAAAGAFAGALFASGYFFPLLKGVEVAAAALLLAGRFVPLALTLLAPILVNVVAFHLVLAPQGMAMPVVLIGLELYLAWAYRDAFAPMLAAKATPRASEEKGHRDLAVA